MKVGTGLKQARLTGLTVNLCNLSFVLIYIPSFANYSILLSFKINYIRQSVLFTFLESILESMSS